MADITFDVWLKRNRKPGESMREAISRYSDEQFVGRRGRDYLTEVFSDEIDMECFREVKDGDGCKMEQGR